MNINRGDGVPFSILRDLSSNKDVQANTSKNLVIITPHTQKLPQPNLMTSLRQTAAKGLANPHQCFSA